MAKGTPLPPDPGEPSRLAGAVAALGLAYAVITSVTRDDLADGGAAHFAAVIAAVRAATPGIRVEALIPDFQGSREALRAVLEAGPDILNHNLETTESMYPSIRRPPENYRRSLAVLEAARAGGARTKSGLMIGLGETREEILRTLADLRHSGCDLLTLGQYLQPSPAHAPVAKYYNPAEFEALHTDALAMGFAEAAAGPLVRSSYEAERLYASVREREHTSCGT